MRADASDASAVALAAKTCPRRCARRPTEFHLGRSARPWREAERPDIDQKLIVRRERVDGSADSSQIVGILQRLHDLGLKQLGDGVAPLRIETRPT